MERASVLLDGLPKKHFRCLAADVPWKFVVRSDKGHNRSPEKHYETMSIEDIAALPVVDYVDDDAFLHFWVTGPHIVIGSHITIMQAWGFEPVAMWPNRHEKNMARWTFAGSAGVLTGPLLLGLFVHLGLGWRGTYALLASISFLCLLTALRYLPAERESAPPFPSMNVFFDGFRAAFFALKRREVWRWLLLLEFADLMMDVLFSFLALYFVDVGRVTESQAGIAVTAWLAMRLITDFLFIPIIDRQKDSIQFLRRTAFVELIAFAGFSVVAKGAR